MCNEVVQGLGHHVSQPRKLLWCRVQNAKRVFYHRHLRKLYKTILASLCRKSLKSLPGFRVWATCRVRTPSSLGPCSNDAHTFLISVNEGWLDPHRWRNQLAVSAEKMRGMIVEKTRPNPGRW